MNQSENIRNVLTKCYLLNAKFDHVTGFQSNKYELNRIFNIVFLGILMLSTIFLNTVAIITIQKSPQLKKKLCYFVILVQSCVDLGVGCVAIPTVSVFLLAPFINVDDCISILLARSTTLLFTGLSVVTLLALTLERYLGVVHPFFHRTRLTKKHIATFVVGGALILLSLVAASIFFQGIIIKHTAIGLLAILFIFVAFAYIRIYLVIRKVKRPKPTPHDKAGEGNRRGLFREAKHAISCFIVVVCFVLFIIPYNQAKIIVGVLKWTDFHVQNEEFPFSHLVSNKS